MLLIHCEGSFFRAFIWQGELVVEPILRVRMPHYIKANGEDCHAYDDSSAAYPPGIRKYTDQAMYGGKRR
jgi:hypothetical protein